MKRLFFTMVAVAAFAVVTTDCAVAQRVGTTIGQTREFAGDRAAVDALPTAADNTAQAYYDAATGEVIVNLGSGLSLLGINGQAILQENLNTAILGTGLDALPNAAQVDETGIGFLNTAGLITSTTPVFSQQAAGGPFNLGALLPAGLSVADFSQFGVDADGLSNIFLSYGLVTGGVSNDGFQVVGGTTAIPEPGSLALLGLAGLGIVARRRR